MTPKGRPPINPLAEAAWSRYRMKCPHDKLAKHLGIARPAVSGWRQVPSKRVDAVAALLGVTIFALRPDLDPWFKLSQPSRKQA